MFPETRQLLCTFHVVVWLERQPGRLSTGTQEQKEKLKATLSSLVYATSETQYEHGKALLLDLLGGNDEHELCRYFIDNWDGIREQLVLYERGNVAHLGNHTNNRLESKWGKIKQVVRKDDSIDELISTLILLQEVAEDNYICEYHRVGSCPQRHANHELAALAKILSPFAYDLVSHEFEYATGRRADYRMLVASTMTTLESGRTGPNHKINTKVGSIFDEIIAIHQ
ncbi:hypothetical protein PC129_g2257 [Phytophthora cactorum]|uniref:MULE transposase domain-containing protein n=1 Tax=Phytophthora cactorum TaxID=29920 RepID=A0A329SVR5_9STRA|nr:hypothetical protein Pcac1_g17964 [Phytophthora cactorum]KAG2841509.1 hypothetical protein PC112_g3348 [Phytophthora cactorum]KAG2865613.1 hypothetical protein PC113_g3568 [Phytophthora cactorum]KAG2925413.1 hypothetical protein PC114_g4135 [Phytophthora cactorum]KAG2940921.1 hypothetical protein PC115_g2267 [Phytophthora cactorum]